MQWDVFRVQVMFAAPQQRIVTFDPFVTGEQVVRKHADQRASDSRERLDLELDLDTGDRCQLLARLMQCPPMAFLIQPMRARHEDVKI